ncbi:MAG: DNA/RNA nuclease SfsA [Gemmatimonadetes bacterium]|nr:DNA/RNA nuclease SfsA [Gemmatimonadota bacterium]
MSTPDSDADVREPLKIPAPVGDVRVTLDGPLVTSRFVDRPNRFLVVARLDDGRDVEAHLPDPGRLEELLLPGRRLWLRSASGAGRRTRWTAVLAETPDRGGLVSLDTTLPNRLVARALETAVLEELAGWRLLRSEWAHEGSRLDFLLEDGAGRRMALEVKSVTLVEDRVALFPDAVTARGARHVRALTALAARERWEAAVLFVVQRPDCERVLAARSIDPDFADALAGAREAGVRVLARRCHVSLVDVRLGGILSAT